jgi:hypothetical protein
VITTLYDEPKRLVTFASLRIVCWGGGLEKNCTQQKTIDTTAKKCWVHVKTIQLLLHMCSSSFFYLKCKGKYMKREHTLHAEVLTMPDDSSTACKNLKTRFQFPPQRSNNSFWAFHPIPPYTLCDTHNWCAAKSTNDLNFWGYSPWLAPNVLEVNSKHTRSAALSLPIVRISKIKCDGKSSIEASLYLLAIYIKFLTFHLHANSPPIFYPQNPTLALQKR